MEKILRRIGNVFLYVANVIHEAVNTADSFVFGILFEGNDFNEMESFYPSPIGRSQTWWRKSVTSDQNAAMNSSGAQNAVARARNRRISIEVEKYCENH